MENTLLENIKEQETFHTQAANKIRSLINHFEEAPSSPLDGDPVEETVAEWLVDEKGCTIEDLLIEG